MISPPSSKPAGPRSWKTWFLRIPYALGLWKLARDTPVRLADLRRDYTLGGLREDDLPPDPFSQFERWFADARQAGIREPNAMTLATADASGRPSARTVLLKGFDGRGFVFFTNYQSRKGRALEENPQASLLFHWEPLERQVEINGTVLKTSPEETNAYFQSRPISNRLGAWASAQSSVLTSRQELEDNITLLMKEYAGREIPVPPFWGGFRVVPETVEFWQGRPSRLHDRLRYEKIADQNWRVVRLSP